MAAVVKRQPRCTLVATYCTDCRILALYVVLIKYFCLIIYGQKLFVVYRNNVLNRYNDLN
jgi:hypothetical protein